LLAADLIANSTGVSDATVDPGQDITVEWTGNNQGSSATFSCTQAGVTVNQLLQPDLIVTDIKMEGQTSLPEVRSGDSVRLDFEVKNRGTATTIRDVHLRWYWGPTEGSTANYIAAGSLGFINGLSPGEVETETDASWTIPALFPGEYWLTGVIDWDGRVSESDEGNNARSESFTVLPDRLTWRDGASSSASLLTTIEAGEDVWAHIEGDPGESFVIEVWEDDGGTGDGGTGDDKVFAFSTTVGTNGMGTFQWTVPWQGDDRNDPENAYYLFHDAFGPNNLESLRLEVTLDSVPTANSYSTPLTYDWGAAEPAEGVIDVTLQRLDSTVPIDPSTRTWIVTHGRNGSFADSDDRVKQLADQIVVAREGEQVLTLDWTEGASFVPLGDFTDFSQESWILPVATWAKHALTNYGFTSASVNLVGHSFGAVISGEIAAAFMGGVNTVLAIDPAEDPVFIASGSDYSTNDVVFGANNSNYAWAFYTPGIAGNEETPTTADEAFVVENSEHSLLVDLVASMIVAPVGEVSRFFSLDRLLAMSDGPWVRNSFDEAGEPDRPGSGYEAVIFTPSAGANAGIRPTGIEYVNKNPFPVSAPGDYDNDLNVDGADFLRWQRSFGEAGENLPADGNFTETIDSGDLRIWQHNVGASPPPAIRVAIQATAYADSNPAATPLANLSLTLELFRTSDDDAQAATSGDSVLEAWFPSAFDQYSYSAAVVPPRAEGKVVASPTEGEENTDALWLSDEMLERVFG
jgi:pimeloyl-ACP methyl ester carboxylesterase